MGCNKIKQRCGDTNYATCIQYELDLPEFSKITDECYNLEETTKDTYQIIGDIKEEINLSELGQNCLIYVQEEGKTIIKNVLLKYEEEICNLKQKVEDLEDGSTICSQSIQGCDLDLSSIVDTCEQQPQTIADLLQILINNQ